MTEFHCLELPRLERFLERRRASPIFLEMNLSEVLVAILRKANEFVPSEAGSILLDNPKKKLPDTAHRSRSARQASSVERGTGRGSAERRTWSISTMRCSASA